MTRLLTLTLVLVAVGASLIAGLVTPARAQMSESELVMRLNRLEGQVRELTGQIEQLQYRNQQLEQQLARGAPAGPPPRGAVAAPQPQPQFAQPPAYQQQPGYQQQPLPPQQGAYPPPPPQPAGRRGDAFDPGQHPNAPGAPRSLGGGPTAAAPAENQASDEPPPYVGAPGGRQAGAPLELGVMAEEANNGPPQRREVRQIPGALPPPPPYNTSGTGQQQMAMAPSNTPKGEYDLAYGYVQHRDYAHADEALRAFLQKYPNDRLAADAHYWLGETLFQRRRYRDAAEIFLEVTTKHEKSGKAPESLLRLGQSLAALKEKEAACATFAEIPRKYPRAGASIKASAEREQKRVGCI